MLAFVVGVIVFVLSILFSIAWHECGHMWAAQLLGMKVRRYFIGFGTKIWSTKRRGTEYGIKAIPLGGFCDIAGMTNLDPLEAEYASKAMYKQKIWKRILVLLAGPLQNFVLGIILVYILAVGWGLPNLMAAPQPIIQALNCKTNEIGQIDAGCKAYSPAAKAGLLPGDIIEKINGEPVKDVSEVVKMIQNMPPKSMITINRNGETQNLKIEPNFVSLKTKSDNTNTESTKKVANIGVYLAGYYSPPKKSTPIAGIGDGIKFTGTMFKTTWQGLISLPGKIPDLVKSLNGSTRDVETPMSVYGASVLGGEVIEHGSIDVFILLLANLNFFLGFFNLSPLLPLDGGHIAVAIYEKIRNMVYKMLGKEPLETVDYAKLMPVTYLIFVILLCYMLLTLSADIINPIRIF